MQAMTRFRRLSRLVAALLLTPLALLAAGVALLHGDAGAAWREARLSQALSTPDRLLSLHGLRLTGLLNVSIERVELADRDGVWAVLSGAGLVWSPAALLGGELRVDALALERAELRRAPRPVPPPPATSTPPSASTSAASPVALSVPRLPIAVRVGRISAGITAAPELAGTALDLELAGQLQAGPEVANARLELRRRGAADSEARLRLGWSAAPDDLALELTVARSVSQLAVALAGAADRVPALAVSVFGSGSLAHWRAAVAGELPDRPCLDGTLGLTRGDGLEAALALRFVPECLPDPALVRPLAGAPVTLAAAATLDNGHLTRLGRLQLTSAAGQASLNGTLEPLDLHLAAESRALDRFGAWGSVQVTGAVTGTLAAPTVSVALNSTEGRAATLRWRNLAGQLHLSPERIVTLRGGAEALALGDHPPQPLRWSALAELDPAATRLRIAEARLDGFGGQVSLLGTVRTSGEVALHGEARLPRLADLQPLTGQPLRGAATAVVAVSGALGGKLDAAVIGRTRGLALGDAEAEAVLGPTPGFSLRATHRRAATVLHARLNGAKMRLALDGAVMPALGLAWRLDLPELPGQSGRVMAQGAALGRLAEPLVSARLDGETVRAGQTLRLAAQLDAAGLDAPAGTLRAALRGGRLDAELSTAFRLDHGVTLTDLALRSRHTQLSGGLSYRDGNLSGALKGQSTDLSPWSDLAGQPLAGSLTLDARLSAAPKSTADVTLSAAGLVAGTARIDKLTGRASITDPLGTPRGSARLEAGGVSAGGTPLRTVTLRADAAGSAVTFRLDAAGGTERQPLSLSTEGSLAAAGDAQTLRLSSLQAKAAGIEARLLAPGGVERRGGTVTVTPLRLSLGGGTAELSGQLRDRALDLRLTLANLPLKLAEPYLPEEARLAGSLSATLKAGGTVDLPAVDLVVSGQGLGLAQGGSERLTATVKALWQNQRLTVDATATGSRGTSVRLAAKAPLPASLQVPDSAPIEARLTAAADLGQWAAALPLPEHKLAGTLAADLTIAGTKGTPLVSGRAGLDQGSYEFYPTATQLRDLTATLTAQDSRSLAITLSATDTSRQGKLSGEGRITLERGVPGWDLAVTLADFRLLNLDSAQARAAAQLSVTGQGDRGRVEGKVSIGPVDYQVTTGPFARRPAKLAVTEINHKSGRRPGAAKPPPSGAGRAPLALDLAVEVELDRVFVRGQGLESDWRGALSIGGTAATPLVRGSLEAVRGTLDMVGQRFTLVDSTILFDGGTKIDPILDITAEATANDITARIKLAGTAAKPELSFTSTPALPSDEVLSRLLFGKAAGELSVTQQLALAKAAASLAGGGGGGFDPVAMMRGGLGLDQLEVGADTGGKGLSPTVKAGKYIDRDTFVRVEQGVASGQEKVTIERRLGHGLSVEADVGRQGGGGVGMSWRKNY
jgi:translocation and assembly module TamB